VNNFAGTSYNNGTLKSKTMKKPVMAKVQSDGTVWCYDENGNYVCGQRPYTGKARSAYITGDNLIIDTDNGKTVVYEIRNGSVMYKSSR
jgi:hypothetical protein